MLSDMNTTIRRLDARLAGVPSAAGYALAFLAGAAAAMLLGGAGAAEAALCGGLLMLWCAAMLHGVRKDAAGLACGAALLALFAARMASLDVISPDCQDYLIPWAKTMQDMTFQQVMQGQVGDYTVLYQYFVFLIARLPLDPVVIYKSLSIGFEALLALAAARLACLARGGEKGSACFRAVFLLVLCLPTVYLNGAVWSQCDAAYSALALYGVYMVLRGRPNAGCVLMALSLCLKLQAVFILPVCGMLLLWGRLRIRHAFTAAGTMALVSVPALLAGKGVKGVLGVYLYQMGEYKQLVLDAPTVFQLVPQGCAVPEDLLSKAGILLAGAAMCAVLLAGVMSREKTHALAVDVCFALVIVIPFFLPHMHERYFYLADILAVVYAAAHPRRLYAPAIVLLGSLNGYLAYLYRARLMPWTLPTLLMGALCAAVMAQIVRAVRRERA